MQLKLVSGVAAASAMALMAGGAAASTNLVLDPNFDNPTGNPGFTTYTTGQTFGPWTVTGASIDLIGDYWQAPVGGGSVDLDGNAPGGVSQNITLAAGSYLLSFYLSGNPDGGYPSTKTVEVGLGGDDQTFTYTTGPSNSETNMGYVQESFRVVVTGGSETLSFASLDPSTSPYGPVIGGVSLTEVPEPATWALMLTGFAAIGAGLRRRRAPAAA